MPGMDGLQLLRGIRERDLDVPVILATGAPSLDTAIRALEYGALRYLTKPVSLGELVTTVNEAVQMCALARIKRDALAVTSTYKILAGDRAGMEAVFARTLDSLWMAFQPIVLAGKQQIFGYEALMRSTEPALPDPLSVIEAAELLGTLNTLGRATRERIAALIPSAPPEPVFFANLHPNDLQDEDLWDPESPLVKHASRVILEITERASLSHIAGLRDRVAQLRKLGFRLAVDDFGAGYAGLTSFANIEPEIVKIDLSLIRDIDTSPVKHRIVSRMTELAHDLGIQVVAEGIESRAERDALIDIGCDYLQGFLFAKPDKPFPEVDW
jgi:EAL domain-containing protein (putative c-di-GMP-specific phosphodiesterase class I)